MKGKNKGFFTFGLAALALMLSLSLALSGCSFTGRRGTDPVSDSSSEEEEQPDRSEVPDDEDPDEESSSSQEQKEESSSSRQDSSKEGQASSAVSSAASAASPAPASSAPPVSSGSKPAASSAPPASSAGSKVSSGSSSANSSSSSKGSGSAASGSFKNVTYVQKGAYTKKESFQNASIKGSGMLIQNKVFYGDVTITDKAGDEGITLQDTEIRGTLTVQGGSDWLKLYGCKIDKLVADYAGAKIYASKGTSVDSVTVKKNATLQEGDLTRNASGFEDIEVSGKSGDTLSLSLKKLETGKLTTRSKAVVSTDEDTKIDIFNARAETRIRGEGEIGELTSYVDGVYYDKKPNKLFTSGGADRPRPYDSSSDWEGNNSSDDEEYDWDKEDVSIDQIDDVVVERGKELTVRVDSDARSLTASSSDRSVATVSVGSNADRLTITAKKVGEATITVKGRRNGYNPDTVKFTVQVVSNASESPKITVVSGDPAAWTNRDVTISFRVSDSDLYEVRADGHTWRNGQTDYSFSVSKNGEYTIEAVDAKGNTAKTAVKVTRMDKEAPQITDLAAAGLNVTFKVTDAGSGVSPSKVQVKSSDGATFTPTLQNGVYRFTGENGKSYTISAADEAGNAAAAKSVSVQADQKPVFSAKPAITADADSYRQQKTVSFAVTYPNGMQPSILVEPAQQASGLQALTTSAAGEGYSVCTYTFAALAQGSYTVTATNAAGSAAEKVNVTKIDRQGPQISEPVVENAAALQPQKKVTFRVTDEGAGVLSVTVDRNIGALKPDKDGVYTFTATAAQTYTIVAADGADNISTRAVAVSNIGNPTAPPAAEIPEATISEPLITPAGFAKELTVSFKVQSQVQAAVDVQYNGSSIPVAGPDANGDYRFTAADNGDYMIIVRNGSKAPAQKTVTVSTVDNTPPEIGEPLVDAATLQVTFDVSDAGSGLQSVTVNQNIGTLTPNADKKYSFKGEAGKTYIITAVDAAGNSVSKTLVISAAPAPAPSPDQPQQPDSAAGKPVIGELEYPSEAIRNALMPSKPVTFKVTGVDAADIVSVTTEDGRPIYVKDGICQLSAEKSSYTITVTTKQGVSVSKNFMVENISEKQEEPVAQATISGSDPTGWTDKKAVVRFTVQSETPVSDVTVSNGTVQQDSTGYYFEAAANGDYTVTVKNGSPTPATHTFHVATIDSQPVSVVFSDANSGSAQAKSLEKMVSFTVNAGESMKEGTVKVTLLPKSGKEVSCPVSGSLSEGYSFTAAQNGTYTVTAVNGAGQSGSASITLDNIGPNASMIGTPKLTPEGWTNGDVTVSFTLQNAEKLSVSASREGATVMPAPKQNANGSYSFAASQNGTYTITITSAYGDTAEKQVSVSNVDKTAPAALPALLSQDANKTPLPADSATASHPIATSDPLFSVSIPATEAEQSAVSVEYSLDKGTKWSAVPVPNASAAAVGQIILPALNEGSSATSYTLWLRAVDKAGNAGQPVTYTITLNAAPAASPEQGEKQEGEEVTE